MPAKINCKKLHSDAVLPSIATDGSAGYDLVAVENITIVPGSWAKCPTGFAMELPTNYAAMVCPRSGLAAKHGITVANSPGIIDADYRGEVSVLLINHGMVPHVIVKGDRIAQMLLVPIDNTAEFNPVAELSNTVRGAGGFGSTGS